VNTAQYFNPPLFTMRVFFPTQTSLLTLNNPFPTNGGLTPPASLNVLSPDIVNAYVQDWSLSVEHAIGKLGSLNVAYAGSKGTHLISGRDANQPRPGPGMVQLRRPHPQFGSVFFIESGANSSYNSLQARFRRQMSSRLAMWAVYTWAKSIDEQSAFLGTKGDRNFPQDSQNPGAERGPSAFDVRHRLALAWSYALPTGNAFTRNTELRGITTINSGQPFTPVLRFDNSNTGNTGQNSGSDRPNVVANPALSERTPERWFDTSAFAVAAPFTFGNAGRNMLRGPGFASFDLSLLRQIPLRNDWSLSLEAQAFNLFNRANFDLPELYADEAATFGKIFSAKAPRQLQFAVRLKF
jgi:hypothetical protein